MHTSPWKTAFYDIKEIVYFLLIVYNWTVNASVVFYLNCH